MTTKNETKVIGCEGTYIGTAHRWAKGLRVQVFAIHRDGRVLHDDAEIGAIRATDVVEFTPEIIEKGKRRWSWAMADATPAEIRFAR